MTNNWQNISFIAGGLALGGFLAAPAFSQQTAKLESASSMSLPAPSPAPGRAAREVWTDDSIDEVRTDADRYLDAKQASGGTKTSPAETAEGSVITRKGSGAPPPVLDIPGSPEEIQKAIDERKSLAENFHTLLSNAQQRLKTETDPVVRKTLAEKANLLELDVKTTNSEIQTLEKALDDYQQGKARTGANRENTPMGTPPTSLEN